MPIHIETDGGIHASDSLSTLAGGEQPILSDSKNQITINSVTESATSVDDDEDVDCDGDGDQSDDCAIKKINKV